MFPPSPKQAFLVLNSGSSSIKFSVFEKTSDDVLTMILTGQLTGIGTDAQFSVKGAKGETLAKESWAERDTGAIAPLLQSLIVWITDRLPDTPLAAAGHRVVHGGRRFVHPVQVTPQVILDLESLIPLAPLHQPQNVSAIRVLAETFHDLPQIACFDTAFHHSQPRRARSYALPRELTDRGLHRYGFHGLSYEYIARHMPSIAPEIAEGRIVVAHLGNGSSLCALHRGESVDTTMGFSALEGVPMGTRSGSIDPGVLIYLIRELGMGADELEHLLYQRSGLLGVSGLSNDMRVLLESDSPDAAEAVDLFCFRVAKEIAALAASMGGIDALVFTAGIGEHSEPVRARICERLAWLGITLDATANARADGLISQPGSLPVLVVPTNEEYMIARHTADLVALKNVA
ncbi:acetate kinase [Rhodospirillum rubrum F11]|uniref:Acetate kinase n=3 Tax=Rhodospirillum rubrum TaxID=1085 RepID=Q2RUC7_RHORT|nr:acetate/propionate family kinase [Rhodospirillum rubrum]ABC22268.1 acetate kinase [Rhodospirillum rubrum ATCC 11170]AEO47986.1 acetate kinase [Rhodospirillum rubrum F11]QXG81910.1 acetate/propionate family kinase [Rhodospirillum rubrum]